MTPFETDELGEGLRVRWVYDDEYETVGSYGLETEEETAKAETWELERLDDGRLVALGAIVERRCGECGRWHDTDSLWGIVIEGHDASRAEMIEMNGWKEEG